MTKIFLVSIGDKNLVIKKQLELWLKNDIITFVELTPEELGHRLDKIGREIIIRLRHEEGSSKGKVWCNAYHEGLADMAEEFQKALLKKLEVIL